MAGGPRSGTTGEPVNSKTGRTDAPLIEEFLQPQRPIAVHVEPRHELVRIGDERQQDHGKREEKPLIPLGGQRCSDPKKPRPGVLPAAALDHDSES